MAILNKEEFYDRLKAKIGDDTSEDSISFLEDMSDTFEALSSEKEEGSTSEEEWQKKYDELDQSWREKYKARFFSSEETEKPEDKAEDAEESGEEKNFDDLFKEV